MAPNSDLLHFFTKTDYTSICNSVQVYKGNRANYVKVKILPTFYKSQLSPQKFIGAVLSKMHPVFDPKRLKIHYSMKLIPTPTSPMWSHQP